MSTDKAAPLVLIDGGFHKWRILRPGYNFGKKLEYTTTEDRRYVDVCVVEGSLSDAHAVLRQLERGEL